MKGYYLYPLGLILGVISVFFYKDFYLRYVLNGLIGYGFFLVVMMVGVLPNKWTLSRRIKKVRGNLSILGFILISPHALMHIFGVFGTIDLFGIAAYALMVPLTIISFKVIKREIKPADWLKIQKGAYGIYLLLFVHLLVVSSWENKIIYAVIVTIYINNKLIKEFRK
jgi:DMSO/TMAO reductase YedYZ heme-binding membrane subunit